MEVIVEERPDADRWRVEYRLDAPASGLRFMRNRNRFRSAHWRVTTPAQAAWRERDGYEELYVTTGTASARFEIEFDSMLEGLPKDYELNKAFSDGSRLLFTGHLDARPLACPSGAVCASAETTPDDGGRSMWRLATAPARWVRLLDQAGVGELSWSPSTELSEQGTYVYFGNIEPLESEHLVAIIDPGMPAWIREETASTLPALFRYYTAEVDVELSRKPLLLLSFGGFERPGRSSGGGVLHGLVELSIEGQGFREPSPEGRQQWQTTLAHEVFHLWNGQRFFIDLGPHEEWLSEGSAEYFARRALLALGAVDEQGFQRAVVEAANACLAQISGRPLLEPPLRFGSFYPCGMTLMAWADGAARHADADIGDVFAAVFAAAARRETARYSTYDFLEQLERVSGHPLATGPIVRVLRVGVATGASGFFARQLHEAGIPVTAVEPGQATLGRWDFERLLGKHLVRCDCASDAPVRHRGGAVEIEASEACTLARDGARVTHIEGHSVSAESAAALQALLARTRAGEPVTVRGDDGERLLRCRDDGVDRSFVELFRPALSPGAARRE